MKIKMVIVDDVLENKKVLGTMKFIRLGTVCRHALKVECEDDADLVCCVDIIIL